MVQYSILVRRGQIRIIMEVPKMCKGSDWKQQKQNTLDTGGFVFINIL